ncbi:hypothetical protein [Priestia endophytica]|uniref:hypothetical protein n=1 Tax=Priestia endophytica TaxID=135735 RepID=UPI00227F648D|nr:hypothetical protein [Priestia endophytica]MCY8233329.1 hypothetical protein [Priestia endophytica]
MEKVYTFIIIGVIAIIGNWIGYEISPIEALPGMMILVGITILGFIIDKIIPLKIPIVIWVSLLALFVSSPICPGTDFIVEQTEKINFMAIATPILAYAGLSFGKDLKEFRKLSWRIVVISIVVYTGTFVLSSLIAEFGFRLTGKFH